MQIANYTIRIHTPTNARPGYWIDVPALPGCFSQGQTRAEAIANVREAIVGFLEALALASRPIPTPA